MPFWAFLLPTGFATVICSCYGCADELFQRVQVRAHSAISGACLSPCSWIQSVLESVLDCPTRNAPAFGNPLRAGCFVDRRRSPSMPSFRSRTPTRSALEERCEPNADFRICVTHRDPSTPSHTSAAAAAPPPPSPPPPCTNATLILSAPFGQCSSLQLWTANDYYSKGSVHVRPLRSIFTKPASARAHTHSCILPPIQQRSRKGPMQPSTRA